MSFLDDLISPEQYNPNVDQGILARIEILIWHSSLDDIQKSKELKKMLNLESVEEAYKMIKFLEDFQPIPGHHRAAMTQYEIVSATRRSVELDDFKERNRKTT